MTNRMKGAFLTLLMLFGTLYPSGQAYANGIPPKIMTVLEKNAFVVKLSKDENIHKLFINIAKVQLAVNFRIISTPEAERKNILKVINNLVATPFDNLKTEDQKKLINLLYVPNIETYRDNLFNIHLLKTKIISNYPEMATVSESEMNNIFEVLVQNEEFKEKLIDNWDVLGLCIGAAFLENSSCLVVAEATAWKLAAVSVAKCLWQGLKWLFRSVEATQEEMIPIVAAGEATCLGLAFGNWTWSTIEAIDSCAAATGLAFIACLWEFYKS